MVQFYIFSITIKKIYTSIGLMSEIEYIASTVGINFLNMNTIESKSLCL